MYRFILFLLLAFLGKLSAQSIAEDVLIRRTQYGIPHILASDLRGVAFGLAYAEMEDYGKRVVMPLISARGERAKIEGYEAIDQDFINQMGYKHAIAAYAYLSQDTRDMMEGFAEGVNFYLEKHPEEMAEFQAWRFSGFDLLAANTFVSTPLQGRGYKEYFIQKQAIRDSLRALEEEGSNAWALAPSRTRSGKAILVRNPHLRWSAGYYEAQLTVPGKLNFYGDFRIGGLFAIIGGFNDRLGWATTNNRPDLDEVYALTADSTQADHVWLDGVSVPLERSIVQAEFKHGNALALERREFLYSPIGPVIHRAEGKVYVRRQAGDGEYRRGEQFVRMMLARNLEEWKEAMRMQAITASNYTYADADGNIFYVWNAATPDLPLPSGGDSLAVPVRQLRQVWQSYVPFDQLPQLENPPGGYLHNENDPFHYTNLEQILPKENYPAHFPQPRLRQRSQHSLQLIANQDTLSLEEVVRRKHSMRMLVADQMKPALLTTLKGVRLSRAEKQAFTHLQTWDNTVAAESRGGLLFEQWLLSYREKIGPGELFAVPWDEKQPMTTPSGLADSEKAVQAFREALITLKEKYGTYDLAWGEVHRLRRGDLDLAVGGGPGGYGCFRVLWFTEEEDGKRAIRGGDGWQLAVEFTQPPRAYSVLAYGQSPDPASPHHTDQAEMFARNEMKRVAFTEDDIQAQLLRSYEPGKE
ncbi:MAG: penicillin acylase family protein [Bacteroidota bacterium]